MSKEISERSERMSNHIEPWDSKRSRGSVIAAVASMISIPAAPVVGVLCIVPSLGAIGGAFAVVGLMLGAIGSFIAVCLKDESQSLNDKELWRHRAIEELKISSGIELTIDEFKKIGYPETAPSDDHLVLGSIDKFLPGGESGFELHRVTLISSQGEIKLVCSKLNSRDFSAVTG